MRREGGVPKPWPESAGGAAAAAPLVILSGAEQKYLRAIEASVQVRDLDRLFLRTEAQSQSLLPHAVMVAMQFAAGGALQRLECLNSNALGAAAMNQLCDRDVDLTVRAARPWYLCWFFQPGV
jgi:hypothetical protein